MHFGMDSSKAVEDQTHQGICFLKIGEHVNSTFLPYKGFWSRGLTGRNVRSLAATGQCQGPHLLSAGKQLLVTLLHLAPVCKQIVEFSRSFMSLLASQRRLVAVGRYF